MTPDDKQFAKYIEILDELQDRMLKAGLIVAHSHFDKAKCIRGDFTPSGQDAVASIAALDMMLEGPLTNRQIVTLWLYFRDFAKQLIRKTNGDGPAA
jgi:hypothetical protein